MHLSIFIPMNITATPEVVESLVKASIADSIADMVIFTSMFLAAGLATYSYFKYAAPVTEKGFYEVKSKNAKD